MRRRSERKKSTDVSSPAPSSTRRSVRRGKKTSPSPSPEKNRRDTSNSENEKEAAELSVAVEDIELPKAKSGRRTSSNSSKDRSSRSPTKKSRTDLVKETIVEENGDESKLDSPEKLDNNLQTEEPPKEEESTSSPEASEKIDEENNKVSEKNDKIIDEKESKIQTPKEVNEVENGENEEYSVKISPPKSKKSSNREHRHSSSERHRRDSKERHREKSRKREEASDETENVEEPKSTEEEDLHSGIENSVEKDNSQSPIREEKEKSVSPEKSTISPERKIEEKENHKSSEKLEQKSVKKRKWLSRKTSENKVLAISSDSLKNLISDPVHPVPLSDVNLESSPEIQIVPELNAILDENSIGRRDRDRERNRDRERDRSNKREREFNQKTPEKPQKSRKKSIEESDEEEGQILSEKPSVERKIYAGPNADENSRSHTKPSTDASTILYITNLVRPFTVLQLKGLLARTGKIVENGFWIDRIKSKCYVKFENEDEATETRHALHGVRWPTSNPKCLIVEFGTDEAMVSAIASTSEDGPKFGTDTSRENRIVTGTGWDGNNRFEEEKKQAPRPVREWDMGKNEDLAKDSEKVRDRNDKKRERNEDIAKERGQRDRERDNDRRKDGRTMDRDRERRRRSHSLEHRQKRSTSGSPLRKLKKENDPPLRLLDDLFRKTKAAPCVYWLPLTPEQITEKEERRLKRIQEIEEHRRERERKEREREKEREIEREQRRRERERDRSSERGRDRSDRNDRRRSRSRDRRRY